MVTDETDDSPEDSTLTGGVVVIAVVDMGNIMNYKKVQDEAYRQPVVVMPPNPQHMGNTPQSPKHKGNIPHITCRYPQKHTDAQESQPIRGGVRHIGEAPSIQEEVPQHAEASENIQIHRGVLGTYEGASEPPEAYEQM